MPKLAQNILLAFIMLLMPASSIAYDSTGFISDYIGKSFTELIAVEGPPDKDAKQPDGMREIAYTRSLANRDFSLYYFLYNNVVEGVALYDKEPETAGFTAHDPRWHSLQPIGFSTKELVSQLGPPQQYIKVKANSHIFANINAVDEATEFMTYNQVYIGGHLYEVTYYPDQNRIQGFTCRSITDLSYDEFQQHVYYVEWTLGDALDKPAWLYRDNEPPAEDGYARRWKSVRFYVDANYLVSILALAYDNSDPKTLLLNFWDVKAAKSIHKRNVTQLLESMQRNWDYPEATHNGDTGKLPWPVTTK